MLIAKILGILVLTVAVIIVILKIYKRSRDQY
jgi:hypothetical protein